MGARCGRARRRGGRSERRGPAGVQGLRRKTRRDRRGRVGRRTRSSTDRCRVCRAGRRGWRRGRRPGRAAARLLLRVATACRVRAGAPVTPVATRHASGPAAAARARTAGKAVSPYGAATPKAATRRPAKVRAAPRETCWPSTASSAVSTPSTAPGTHRPAWAATSGASSGSTARASSTRRGSASRCADGSCCCMGGDEFVVVCENLTDTTATVIERVREGLVAPHHLGSESIVVGA